MDSEQVENTVIGYGREKLPGHIGIMGPSGKTQNLWNTSTGMFFFNFISQVQHRILKWWGDTSLVCEEK